MFCLSKTAWSTVDFPVSESSLLTRELLIINRFNTGLDKPFEDLVRYTKQRYWAMAHGVATGFHWLCDRDYQRSSPDFVGIWSRRNKKKGTHITRTKQLQHGV